MGENIPWTPLPHGWSSGRYPSAVIDSTHWLLTLSCADRPGIVHQVTGEIVAARGNITELQQFTSTESGRFFMRVQVQSGFDRSHFERAFATIA